MIIFTSFSLLSKVEDLIEFALRGSSGKPKLSMFPIDDVLSFFFFFFSLWFDELLLSAREIFSVICLLRVPPLYIYFLRG